LPEEDFEDADDLEEVEGEEDPEDELSGEKDFFITDANLQPESQPVDLQTARTQARALALQGEHKIYPSSPSGPGSLAEALAHAFNEGLLNAVFADDGLGEPFILYSPRSGSDA
jgi:hypothetical protein